MTDETTREVVARAICRSGGFDPDEKMPNDGPRWRYYLEWADAAIAYLWPLAMAHAAKLAQNFKGLPNEMLVAAIRAQEPPK